jgi:hypothetical protein
MVGQRLGTVAHLMDQRGDTRIDVGTRFLHQPAGIQDEGLTRHQIETGLRILLVPEIRGDSQRQASARLRDSDPPVGVPDQWSEVSGAHRTHRPRGEVHLRVRRRGEPVGVQLGEEARGPRQHGRRGVPFGGVGAQGDA